MTVQPYVVIEVNQHRWQINQGASMVGLRLTLEDAIQAAARYTAQELIAGNTIEQPWPIRVEFIFYTYKPLLRPAHGCGLPFEWDYVEAPRLEPHIARLRNLPLSRYDHGVIETKRPLTAEERDRFGLQPV